MSGAAFKARTAHYAPQRGTRTPARLQTTSRHRVERALLPVYTPQIKTYLGPKVRPII